MYKVSIYVRIRYIIYIGNIYLYLHILYRYTHFIFIGIVTLTHHSIISTNSVLHKINIKIHGSKSQ